MPTATDFTVDDFMAALAPQESGGNPNARNPRTGAYGRWQIMPSNWPSWAEEAGLGRDAPQTPENQATVARYKMQQYHDQFGSWEAVAVAWFAGPDDGARYAQGDRSMLDGGDGNMTIGAYVNKVMDALGSPTSLRDTNPRQADAAQGWTDVGDTPGLADTDPIDPGDALQIALESMSDKIRAAATIEDGATPDDPTGDAKAATFGEFAEERAAQVGARAEATAAANPSPQPTPRSSGGGSGGPNPQFVSALQAFVAASGGRVTIQGGGDYGYRSNAEQQALWDAALEKYGDPEIADNWVARPGNSNHEKGVAADLKYADDDARRWAHANAARFGLHFPLANEAWHVELQGSR